MRLVRFVTYIQRCECVRRWGFFFFSYSSRKTVIEYRLENAAMELRVKGESFGPDSSNLYPLKCAFDLLEKKLEYITTKMNWKHLKISWHKQMQYIGNVPILEYMSIIRHFSYGCHTSAVGKTGWISVKCEIGYNREKKSILYHHYQMCVSVFIYFFPSCLCIPSLWALL